MRNLIKFFTVATILFIFSVQPAWSAGPPAPSLFNNPLAITFIIIMLLLLIVIGILANIVVGAADVRLKKRLSEKKNRPGILTALLLLSSSVLRAQDAAGAAKTSAARTIGGMDATAFYIMVAVLFLELAVIIGLLINIKFLLRQEKEKLDAPVPEKAEVAIEKAKEDRLSWWDRFNKLRPVSQEAELDLGHEYDGIRELNNRLPPWWLYGFYVTILFAAIYLWRFHVSHTGPSSVEEYERSVARAEIRVQEYLKKKGEAIDENTVTLLTSAEDIEAGKAG